MSVQLDKRAEVAAALDYELGHLVRETYAWDALSHAQRVVYVEHFIRIWDAFGAAMGRTRPRYSQPWTDRELGTVHGADLRTTDPPIVTAVRVYERIRRSTGAPPRTLNAKPIRGLVLDDVPHGRSLAELESEHRRALAPACSSVHRPRIHR